MTEASSGTDTEEEDMRLVQKLSTGAMKIQPAGLCSSSSGGTEQQQQQGCHKVGGENNENNVICLQCQENSNEVVRVGGGGCPGGGSPRTRTIATRLSSGSAGRLSYAAYGTRKGKENTYLQ